MKILEEIVCEDFRRYYYEDLWGDLRIVIQVSCELRIEKIYQGSIKRCEWREE